jgi:hypothetical protein
MSMNKGERDKYRADAMRPDSTIPSYVVDLIDHIDALEVDKQALEQKVELVTVDGKNYHAGDVRMLLSRIDALEGIITNLSAPIYSDEKAFALTRYLHRANPNWAAEQLHEFGVLANTAIASASEGK